MKIVKLLAVVLISAATSFGVIKATAPDQVTTKNETAFERVMRTNTLRCGYVLTPPQLARDPNTGSFSGIAFDITEEIAKRLNLKVEWSEETNFATLNEALKNGRFDALCFTSYRWVPGARGSDYTTPLFYTMTTVYARPDDHRFDNNPAAINDPSVKMITIDAEASTFIHDKDFPKSTPVSFPVGTEFSLALEAVAANKADVAVMNPLSVMPYLAANPNKVVRVPSQTPLRLSSHALIIGKGETDLLSTLNVVIDEMHFDGTMDKILDKYEAIEGSIIRIEKPFKN